MARYVIDCGVALYLAAEEIAVPEKHELLAPTLLRSQTLSALHEAVHAGKLDRDGDRSQELAPHLDSLGSTVLPTVDHTT